MQVSCSANSVLLLKRILKLTLKTTFRHCFPSSRAHENNEELHRRVVFLLISLLTFPFHSLSFEILLTPTISGNSDHYKVVNQSWCLFSFWIWGLTSVFKNEHTHTHTHPGDIGVGHWRYIFDIWLRVCWKVPRCQWLLQIWAWRNLIWGYQLLRIQVIAGPDSFCPSSLISVPVRSALPALLSYFRSGRAAIYKFLASGAGCVSR